MISQTHISSKKGEVLLLPYWETNPKIDLRTAISTLETQQDMNLLMWSFGYGDMPVNMSSVPSPRVMSTICYLSNKEKTPVITAWIYILNEELRKRNDAWIAQ